MRTLFPILSLVLASVLFSHPAHAERCGAEQSSGIKQILSRAVSKLVAKIYPSSSPEFPTATVFTTSFEGVEIVPLKPSSAVFSDASAEGWVVDIDPARRHQEIWGFGANVTLACLKHLNDLSEPARAKVMENFFSAETGAGFSYIRVPLGGNDFSLSDYTPGDTPGNRPDPELKHFDLSKERGFLTFIRDARKYNPEIRFMISPWTPPAWMKDTNHLRGGQLKHEYFDAYARYIVKAIDAYRKEGIEFQHLSIMNEPLIGWAKETWHFPQGYMTTDDQRKFIAEHLAPLLRTRPDIKTKTLLVDHNWDIASEGTKLLKDANVREVAGGIAYHCYGGNLQDMINVMNANPGIPAFQTECTATQGPVTDNESFHWWLYNQSLEAVRAGSSGSLGWNFCLDQKGGPINGTGCQNCKGLVTIDRSNPAELKPIYHQEFYSLAHTSKLLKKGAVRVDSSDAINGVSNVAFVNPDGTRVMVLRNDRNQEAQISVRNESCQTLKLTVPARGAVSLRWGQT